MGKFVYLSYYSTEQVERSVSPAAITMTKYIINALNNFNGPITIISPAQAKGARYYAREEEFEELNQIIFLPSYYAKPKNCFLRFINRIRRKNDLKRELYRQVRDGDTLIVYHSLALMNAIKWILKRREIKLIIQVCEIYADVINDTKERKRELNFFKLADAYIFSSEQLEEKINSKKKKYAICLGTYQVEPDRREKFNDGKIHVVYAGTFDPRKGGAIAAAAAGEFLPENYHIHIIGFGMESDKKYLLDKIKTISEKSKCTVTYDGLKSGEDYIRFIQSCDIGLSTQNPDVTFNNTSFPSKVLSYMANGLRVVSIRILAVTQSSVGKYIYYYNNQTGKDLAEEILKVDINDNYCGKEIIRNLNSKFIDNLKELLE